VSPSRRPPPISEGVSGTKLNVLTQTLELLYINHQSSNAEFSVSVSINSYLTLALFLIFAFFTQGERLSMRENYIYEHNKLGLSCAIFV
jgi:hypothetical protein